MSEDTLIGMLMQYRAGAALVGGKGRRPLLSGAPALIREALNESSPDIANEALIVYFHAGKRPALCKDGVAYVIDEPKIKEFSQCNPSHPTTLCRIRAFEYWVDDQGNIQYKRNPEYDHSSYA